MATAIVTLSIGGGLVVAAPAPASTSYVVQPGETLSGIAAVNGLTTESLAAWNGLAADHLVVTGSSIMVPTPEEAGPGSGLTDSGAASAGSHVVVPGETLSSIAATNGLSVTELAAANGIAEADLVVEGTTLSIPAPTGAVTGAPAPALGAVWSPEGDVYLDGSAADSWNAMRQRSLSELGVDLYPAGSLSGYRSSAQQAALYESYLSGAGAPANPPGSSSHELGLSVDLADEAMRSAVDQLGWEYGWGKYEAPEEWWHVTYGGG